MKVKPSLAVWSKLIVVPGVGGNGGIKVFSAEECPHHCLCVTYRWSVGMAFQSERQMRKRDKLIAHMIDIDLHRI